MQRVIEQPEHHDSSSFSRSSDLISNIIAQWCALSPERPAIVADGAAWTYSRLATVIDDMESWLLYLGVRPRDRVMVLCENCRAAVAFFFSLRRLDALPVFVNASLAAVAVDEIRDDNRPRLVLYTTVSRKALEHAKRHQARIAAPIDLGSVAIGRLDNDVQPEDAGSDINRPAVICASGAMIPSKLTHDKLVLTASAAAKALSLTPDDRVCGLLPVSGVDGLSKMLFATLWAGATMYMSSDLTAEALAAKLTKDRLTVVIGDRNIFSMMVEYARVRKLKALNSPALRTICCSGTPLDPTLQVQAERLFGTVMRYL